MRSRINLIFVFMITALSLSCFALDVYAAPKTSVAAPKPVAIHLREKPLSFLGGKPPAISSLKLTDQVGDSSGRKAYRFKAQIRRSSGDTDGRFVIYKAPNWRIAITNLLRVDLPFQAKAAIDLMVWNARAKFPSVLALYSYSLKAGGINDLFLVDVGGAKRRKGPKKYTQDIIFNFVPGKHIITLSSRVDLGDHPLLAILDIPGWFSFLLNLEEELSISKKLEELKDSLFDLDPLDMAKDKILEAIEDSLVSTEVQYEVNVRTKVPSFKNMTVQEVNSELYESSLKSNIRYSTSCDDKKNGRVIRQSPTVGRWVNKDTIVLLKICSKAVTPKATPTPKPIPGTAYYIYNLTNAGNTVYITTPDSLKGLKLCQITGAGTNCAVDVIAVPLLGPFANRSAAEEALCDELTARHYFSLVPWGPWVRWGESGVWGQSQNWYRCFEYSCQGALSHYCPNLPIE